MVAVPLLQIEAYAKRLRLPAIKKSYKEMAHDAMERQIPYEDFFWSKRFCNEMRIKLHPAPNKQSSLQLKP